MCLEVSESFRPEPEVTADEKHDETQELSHVWKRIRAEVGGIKSKSQRKKKQFNLRIWTIFS